MAAKFLVSGGNGNWNSITNWSLTSGGVMGAPFPVNGDDVIIDNNSGNADLIITPSSACTSFTVTGTYSGTLSGTGTLTIAGAVTFNSSMTITATGVLVVAATATLTSAGKTWLGDLNFAGSNQTFTLADNWTVAGVTQCNVVGTSTVNGNSIYALGGYNSSATNKILGGTTTIRFENIIPVNITNGSFSCNVVFNSSSTITFSANMSLSGGTFTYTAGTIITTGNTITITGASITLNIAGLSLNNVTLTTNNMTITLLSGLVINGTLSATVGFTFIGLFNITVANFLINITASVTRNFIFVAGAIFRITTDININGTAANTLNLLSDTPGTKAKVTLDHGATQDIGFITVTDIDSSDGITMYNYKKTISNSLNWRNLSVPPTISSTFIS